MSSGRIFVRLSLAILVMTVFAQAVSAQSAERRPQWEYSAITQISAPFFANPPGTITATASICYFQPDGCRREEVKFEATLVALMNGVDPRELSQAWVSYAARDKAAQGALAKAIAKLGDDGWEMTGQAASVADGALGNTAIHFKRRK